MTIRSIIYRPLSTRVTLQLGAGAKAQDARVTMESQSQAVAAGQRGVELQHCA
jgi:hypothetical protein